MSLRETKKARTRADILDTAERLFRQRGFAETSIRTIATAVPVSVQTLYNYFPSKEGILAAIAAERFDAMAGAAEQMRQGYLENPEAEGSSVERFLHLVRWGLRALDRDRDFMRLVFLYARSATSGTAEAAAGAALSSKLRDRRDASHRVAVRMFESMQKTGALRSDVPAEECADLYALVFTERVTRWFLAPEASLEDLERGVIGGLEIVLRGLAPDAASTNAPDGGSR